MEKIDQDRAKDLVAPMTGWTLGDAAISREFTFRAFADAVAFAVRLGFAAERADHHPAILIDYRRVTVTYTTHSAGGLTDKDFAGATAADAAAAAFAPGEVN